MSFQDRINVPLSPLARELVDRLVGDYPGFSRSRITMLALEAGLRQIAIPSGAPSAVRLPLAEGF